MREKKEGDLGFDVNTGKFWLFNEDGPVTELDFGDTFEVLDDDKWIETSLEIINDDNGDLAFRLKGTSFYGAIDGLRVRI